MGAGFRNGVAMDQIAGKSARGAVVEQNKHYGQGGGASALCAAKAPKVIAMSAIEILVAVLCIGSILIL